METGILIIEFEGGYRPIGECLRTEIKEMIAAYLRDGPVAGFEPPERFVFWTRGKGGEYDGEEVWG